MRKGLLIILFSLLTFIGCSNNDNNGINNDNQTENAAPSLKDDYYESVNYAQLSTWVIPENESSISYNTLIVENINKRLNNIIHQIIDNNSYTKGSDEYNIAAFYETFNDYESRNSAGLGMLQSEIDELDETTNINDFLNVLFKIEHKYGFNLLINNSIVNNQTDNSYIYSPSVYSILMKEQFNDESQLYKNELQKLITKLFVINGKSEQEASIISEKVVNMMHDIANSMLDYSDKSNPSKVYTMGNFNEYAAVLNNLITVEELNNIYGTTGDTALMFNELDSIKKTVEYLTDDNLELLKNYVKSMAYCLMSEYTSEEALLAYYEYDNNIKGISQTQSVSELTDKVIKKEMEYELGRKYVEQYFSDEIKKDIETMIVDIKNLYRERLNNLSWMSNETKIKAIEKLDKMKYYVGVGEGILWPQDLYAYSYDKKSEGGIAINNILNKSKKLYEYVLNEYKNGNKVKTNIMARSPQEVNAYYMLQDNSINILPGIINAPYYSKDASKESNLGGIGYVIGHEITHAFDKTGSLFDADGNIGESWWQPEDYAKFQELTNKVVAYYDNYTINGQNVNGTLTLSENIADLGSMSCITEYALKNNYDLDKIYKNYASLLAVKEKPELTANNLITDAHSPKKVRVNAVLSATEDFYTLYDIKETDGMYKSPSIRPSIW